MKKLKPHTSAVAAFVLFAFAAGIGFWASPSMQDPISEGDGFGRSFVLASNALPRMGLAGPSAGSDTFRFLPPLAPNQSGNVELDRTLLDHLKVEVCEVNIGGCSVVKTMTSQGALPEQLRISGRQYMVNWDTRDAGLSTLSTYRIRVVVADLQLGSIDLSPAAHGSLGRTWPIKFVVEPDPRIRIRLLRFLGRSASQIANALRTEFNLCGQESAAFLANDQVTFTAEEIEIAIDGVCQNAVIPATTKISDEATRNVLAFYDPEGGQMTFSEKTQLLDGLNAGDVLVSEPGPSAPYGYLRKVTAIQRQGKTTRLNTVQAKITEAVSVGSLNGRGELQTGDLVRSEALVPGVTFETSENAAFKVDPSVNFIGPIDIGEGFKFNTGFDLTFQGGTGIGGVQGNGQVRIRGSVRFNAGYNVGIGIETCAAIPPVCVDRFEAWAGVEQYSNIRIDGQFTGTFDKELTIARHHFGALVFFIGPIPVVLVPVVDVVIGIDGNARLEFYYSAELRTGLKVGAKWTDPDDGGQGWEDISEAGLPSWSNESAGFDADMGLLVYGKGEAKLLFYGVAGPGFNLKLGLGGDVKIGRNPLWRIYGYIASSVIFSVDIAGLDLSEHRKDIFSDEFDILEASNQPPVFSNIRSGPIKARVGIPVFIGPDAGFGGRNYDVIDPEGEAITLSASSPGGVVTNNPLRIQFATPGLKTVTITARDPEGLTSSIVLGVDVRNSPPEITLTPNTAVVSAMTQLWISATAYDPEEGTLLCDHLNWSASGSHTLNVSTNPRACSAVVKFNDPGPRTVTVTATDSNGGTMSKTLNVNVGPRPEKLLPEIELDSFSIKAISRYRVPSANELFIGCFPSVLCEVPDGGILDNGQEGDYISPLIMRLGVSHPEGDPVAVQWHCRTGDQFAPVTNNGDGSYSCSPFYSPTEPITVYAVVGPPPDPFGDNLNVIGVRSEQRTFFMLQRIH
ncbi:MAG TPA: hypothetical protein PKD26_15360 [Pyrinomonadaceae bacterium]|nr:hypothetical protein [Pyrinomonadaceae bacterium]